MIAQTMDRRVALKWIAVVASVIWIAVTFYQEFLDTDPNQYGFRSTEVEARMKACGGSFQQRYDCKDAIIIAKGHDSFLFWWVESAALVLGPPLILAFLLNRTGHGKPYGTLHDHLVGRPMSVSKRRVRR